MADMVAHGEDLSELPGIGVDIGAKIKALVRTGHLPLLEQVETRTKAFDFHHIAAFWSGPGRRGWLEADDVLNTRPLKVLKRLMKRV